MKTQMTPVGPSGSAARPRPVPGDPRSMKSRILAHGRHGINDATEFPGSGCRRWRDRATARATAVGSGHGIAARREPRTAEAAHACRPAHVQMPLQRTSPRSTIGHRPSGCLAMPDLAGVLAPQVLQQKSADHAMTHRANDQLSVLRLQSRLVRHRPGPFRGRSPGPLGPECSRAPRGPPSPGTRSRTRCQMEFWTRADMRSTRLKRRFRFQ